MPTKILLVEDNDEILRILAMCLQFEGLTVEQAHDGLEAFQKLEDQTFDVVVSDIRMPGLNGFDLVGRILDRFTGTPIVLITGDPTAQTMDHVTGAGVSCVLISLFKQRSWSNQYVRPPMKISFGALQTITLDNCFLFVT